MPKRVKVTSESDSGRNQHFHDNFKNTDMTRTQFVKEIQGGIKNATAYWTVGCTTPTDCNGNGNGIIGSDDPDYYEGHIAWHHLSLAGMTNGAYTPLNSALKLEPGRHIPAGPYEATGYVLRNLIAYEPSFRPGLEYGGPNTGGDINHTNDATVPGRVAESVDRKFDDGLAVKGFIRSVGGTGDNCSGQPYNNFTGAGSYQVANAQSTCSMNWFFK